MPKTDLKIYSNDSATGSKVTTSVTYVNPDASNSVLKSFAQQLNALTTNVYDSADRVETVNVDTDNSRKQFRNITITGAERNSTATIAFTVTDSVKGSPAVFFVSGDAPNYTATYLASSEITSTDPNVKKCTVTVPNAAGWLQVGLRSNEAFYADFTQATVS